MIDHLDNNGGWFLLVELIRLFLELWQMMFPS